MADFSNLRKIVYKTIEDSQTGLTAAQIKIAEFSEPNFAVSLYVSIVTNEVSDNNYSFILDVTSDGKYSVNGISKTNSIFGFKVNSNSVFLDVTGTTIKDITVRKEIKYGVLLNAALTGTTGQTDFTTLNMQAGTSLQDLYVTGNSQFLGTLDVDGTTSLDDVNIAGFVDITGSLDVDNIKINGNTISSKTNEDIILNPNGTGIIKLERPVTTDQTTFNLLNKNLGANSTYTINIGTGTDTTTEDSESTRNIIIGSDGLDSDGLPLSNVNIKGKLTVDGEIATQGISEYSNLIIKNDNNTATFKGILADGTEKLIINNNGNIDSEGTLDVGNIKLDTNTISSTNTNGNIVLVPNGIGILDLKAATSIDGTLTVTGTNKTTLGGALEVDGSTQLDGTLTVTGTNKTTLNGALEVDGASQLDGAVTVNNTLTVTGTNKTTLNGALEVDGATQLDGTLTVTGTNKTTLNGALEVDGSSQLDGVVDVNNTLTVDGSNISLDSTGTMNINLDTNSSSNTVISIQSSNVGTGAGNISIVADSTTVTSNVTITGNLSVTGTTTTNNVELIETSNGIVFEGTTANDFETTLKAIDPTADRLIQLPDIDGTVVTTGDTGTVTNTMLANSTISGIALGNNLNSVTFNNSGTGDASATTFNGSTARTISYNSLGASPLAGSTSLTTLGTIATGTWQGSTILSTYGGTGVNNGGRTLTINTANKTLAGAATTLTFAGNFTTNGAFPLGLTTTADTSVTLPTSGTLYGTATGSITSAQLAGSVSDETGFSTGAKLVFSKAPEIEDLKVGTGTQNWEINTSNGDFILKSGVSANVDALTLTTTGSLTLNGNRLTLAGAGSPGTTLGAISRDGSDLYYGSGGVANRVTPIKLEYSGNSWSRLDQPTQFGTFRYLIVPFSTNNSTYIHVSIANNGTVGLTEIGGSENQLFTNPGPIIVEYFGFSISGGFNNFNFRINGIGKTFSSTNSLRISVWASTSATYTVTPLTYRVYRIF
jgi:hypothetical protein